VRWDNLVEGQEQRARLPGYRDDAVVRHFDAPDSIPTRFYEVRAKSILNRVPEASRMPFRWTINPYRGCSHACVYCMGGDTRVLGADGRETALRDLAVGDAIYGTRRAGAYRRLVETRVLAKWSRVKPAFRVVLEDGTELIASGDHRFLTRRGWKHVSGTQAGPLRRPHLTVGMRFLGPGGSSPPPLHDADYRRGYLCGMIRGDGTLGFYRYRRPGRADGDVYRFRVALADREALERTRAFLDRAEVHTTQFAFAAAANNDREIAAIRSQSRAGSEAVRTLIDWPALPNLSWVRGFLAGIFDAEGSCSRGVLRISNTDDELVDWTVACLRRLSFDCVVERRPGFASAIRVRGGLHERMRFMLTCDPVITRKRSIGGMALKSNAPLRVARIVPFDVVMPMYDITTGTGDFIANGVVSHNCFARPTHKYLDFDAGRDFEREIVVKVNAPERLRVELARPSWKGEHIALGTNTDPYQWVEGRYKLMVGIWEAMLEARNPSSVLTKSPLLLRDLALMSELARRTDFTAALSVPTLDERAWRATEPHTPHPRARLEAVAELNRAGIRTGILVAPLMPGINDSPEQVSKILELATEAGAAYVTGIALHLRGEVRRLFFDWLAEQRPDLLPRYRELYRNGAYASTQERRRLARLVAGPDIGPAERGRGALPPLAEPVVPAPPPRQESLFEADARVKPQSPSGGR
jgi:DNA repair photolyase